MSKSAIIVFGIMIVFLMTVSCVHEGLVRDKYDADYYKVAKLLPDGPFNHNPKFIVYGDNRVGWRLYERFVFDENWKTWKMALIPFYQIYLLGNGLIGGFNYRRKYPDFGQDEQRLVRDAIYAEAKKLNVDFVMNNGDMPTHGNYPEHWKIFLDINKVESPFLREIPFVPVAGNHEHASDSTYGAQNYRDIFDYPQFFVLNYADADIIVLDSDLLVDQYQDIDDKYQDELFKKWFVGTAGQPSWLEEQLAACQKNFKIVALHHPPVSFGKHYHDWEITYYRKENYFLKFCKNMVFS